MMEAEVVQAVAECVSPEDLKWLKRLLGFLIGTAIGAVLMLFVIR